MGYNKFVLNGVTKIDLTADTVDAAHLAQGYTAHGADGDAITGTLAPDMEKLYSGELTLSYSSTSAATAATINLGASAYTGNAVLYIRVRDKAGKRPGYFYGTDSFLFNKIAAMGGTDTAAITTNTNGLAATYRIASDGTFTDYCTYNGYGLYPYSITSGGVLSMRKRYNATYTLTVDGTYTIDVYRLSGAFADWFGAVS